MTSTHKAGRAGHAIKADVGGAGFQTERDKMAESRPNPVTFDRALQREQSPPKTTSPRRGTTRTQSAIGPTGGDPRGPSQKKKKDAGQRNVPERLGGLAHARTRPSRLALQGSGLHAVVFATAIFPLRHTA